MPKLNLILVGCIVCGLSTLEFLVGMTFDRPAYAQRSIFGENIPPFHSNEGPVPMTEDLFPDSSSSVPLLEVPAPSHPVEAPSRAKPLVKPLRLGGQSNAIFINPNFYPHKGVLDRR